MSKKEIVITGMHNRRGIRFCNKEKYIIKERKFYSDISCNFNQDDIKKLIPKLYLKMETIDDFSLEHLEMKIIEEVKVKQASYINQDSKKKRIIRENREKITTEQIVEKLLTSLYKCYYCKEGVQILYENTREPKQWTLERIDNEEGHTYDNCVIACLECNLKRRNMNIEKFEFTQNLKIIKKE
jgi:hypothetical protein